MTIPKHTALTLLERAKLAVLADLNETLARDASLVDRLCSIDSGYTHESMLVEAKRIVREGLIAELFKEEMEKSLVDMEVRL